MKQAALALAALLIAIAAPADTLISNVNGIQVGARRQAATFRSLLVGDDGRVKQVMANAARRG